MSVQEAVLLGLEQTLNRVLALDSYTAERLAAFHGKVIGFEIRGFGFSLYLVPGASGRVQLFSRIEGEPDCLTRGAPLDLLNAAFADRKEDALFSGRLEIRGDTQLAHRFSELLVSLDIDWEEQLAKLAGDPVAHEAGRAFASTGRWAARAARVSGQDLGEYLQEEARLLPTRYEVEEWQDGVDNIREDLDRLEARIARLERNLGSSGGGR